MQGLHLLHIKRHLGAHSKHNIRVNLLGLCKVFFSLNQFYFPCPCLSLSQIGAWKIDMRV